ncbi:MAG: protein-disulfide reductase DsbD domain-containing protein, partial [Myxococcota bacterium]
MSLSTAASEPGPPRWMRALGIVLALLSAGLVAPTAALAAPGATGDALLGKSGARVRAELLVDAARVAPGDRVAVGVLLELEPGWHVYWKHPGDSGAATKLAWRSPAEGIGPIAWPAPQVFAEADGLLTTYGYEDEVLLASEATVAADAETGWSLAVDVDFVACLVECVPGSVQLARTVPVGASTEPATLDVLNRFARAEHRLPRTAEALGVTVTVRAASAGATAGEDVPLVLEVVSCEGAPADCRPWTLAAEVGSEAFIPAARARDRARGRPDPRSPPG